MPRLTRDEIVARMERRGLCFRTLSLQTEGDYLPTDVDWNNKDVLHLNEVHSWVQDVTCVIDRDLQATISLQKAFGIPFPLVLVHYDAADGRQVHFETILAWTIVTDHEFIPVTPTRTRAVTTYCVGANRFWMLFWPVIVLAIKRNYRRLMSEDVPLRDRRGVLRSWGYSFRGDDGLRDIRSSLSLNTDNVVPPAPEQGPGAAELTPIPVPSIGSTGWTFIGRTDHLGLKLRRDGRRILAYPRMCPHEGADLDTAEVTEGCLSCPWHGRRLAPVAELDLNDPQPRAETATHRLQIHEDHLHVSVRAGQSTDTPDGSRSAG